jgi:hypothetical protein
VLGIGNDCAQPVIKGLCKKYCSGVREITLGTGGMLREDLLISGILLKLCNGMLPLITPVQYGDQEANLQQHAPLFGSFFRIW